jgi:hypothetical protein
LNASDEDCDDLDPAIYRSATLYTDVDGDNYTEGTGSTVCYGATLPAGTTLTQSGSDDCDDNNPGTFRTDYLDLDSDGDRWSGGVSTTLVCYGATAPTGYVLVSLGADCDDTNPLLTNNCITTISVNLKLFIEGYYLGAGTMNSVKLNQDGVSPPTEVEDLTIELHDATTYELIYSGTATLAVDGTIQAEVDAVSETIQNEAESYYIAVTGTNLIRTWSALPRQTIGGTIDYDFSTAASQAYGDNMIEIEPGVFAFYSGDTDQNGNIDSLDYTQWELDYNEFASGAFATDLDGNGNVDTLDYTIWEINYNNFISSSSPTP